MPFTPQHTPEVYIPNPTPLLQGSDKLHYDRELRRLREVIQSQTECIKELQTYVATL
jgi:hypothetical protein